MESVEKWVSFFSQPFLLYCLALFGMIVHYVKKKVKNDSLSTLWKYIKAYPLSTFISLGIMTLLFVGFLATLQTGKSLDYIAVFTIGYTVDSFFSRYDELKK